MALNVPARNKCLKNLTCAYTGKPIEVRMIEDSCGELWYFSPDAYDPSVDESPNSVELFSRLAQREGIRSSAVGSAVLRCAYTGEALVPTRTSEGTAVAVGGFAPSNPVCGAEEFARRMMMRGGVIPPHAPKVPRADVTISAQVVEPVEKPESETSHKEMADEVADRAFHKERGTVTITNPGIPKKKEKK